MTIESIKVDIIIPVYNKEKYIKKCIDSILNQIHKNFNLILVDDGSTDTSGEICEIYQKMDKRIKCVHQPNGGQISARKRGLEYAETELILFIDADDWIDDNYLEVLISELYKHGFKCDLIVSGMILEDNEDSTIVLNGVEKGVYIGEKIEDIRERFIFDEVSHRQGIAHSMSGKIFKKSMIKDIFEDMNDNLTYDEDGISVFAYLLKIKYLVVLDYVGYHYVQYEESTIHSYAEKDVWRIKLLMEEYIKLAKKAGIYEKIRYNLVKFIDKAYLEVVSRSIGCLIGSSIGMRYEDSLVIPRFLNQNNIKFVVYGAGRNGKRFKKKISQMKDVKCVGWVDKNYEKIPSQYGVDSIERLLEWEYDYIFITIENRVIVHAVIENLLSMGIPYKKIWELEKERHYY